MNNEVKFRHEMKYDITYDDYITLRIRLKKHAEYDINASEKGYYKIHSLFIYNPDIDNNNEIFRIRYYNNDTSYMVLEKKTMIESLCMSRKAIISRDICEHILSGDIEYIADSKDMLVKELYAKMKYRYLRPMKAEHYIREPFYLGVGKIRITMDRKIHSSDSVEEFFETPKLSGRMFNNIIMRFKYDEPYSYSRLRVPLLESKKLIPSNV